LPGRFPAKKQFFCGCYGKKNVMTAFDTRLFPKKNVMTAFDTRLFPERELRLLIEWLGGEWQGTRVGERVTIAP
jgi:hypothetical protein